MTNPTIQDFDITDTEYATLAASCYEPALERQLIEAGVDPNQAKES